MADLTRRIGLGAVVVLSRAPVRWITLGLSLVIVSVSVAVLFHLLRDIDLGEVVEALGEREPRNLMLAGGFVALAYTTLTFYDWFALRTIGVRHIPYRVAAMTSFCSYCIGHNIGATAFSAGAIRYRIYSHWQLSVLDVAKICFVTGLTFWLGNLTVLGFGMSLVPQASTDIDQLPLWANRLLGVTALCLIVGYVAWAFAARRTIGLNNWALTLPSGPSTLVQIGIGVIDLGCCSLAMYMLMPDEPHIGFFSFAVVFVTAALLGFASHAPGSIGVFDAAILLAFMHVDKEDVVAAVVLFRLLYFVLPFAVAVAILATREFLLLAGGQGGTRPIPSSNVHASRNNQ